MNAPLKIAVLNPAGNTTAVVLSDVPLARRAALSLRLLQAEQLEAEQVAFLAPPRYGGEIRLEMMGGEFCGNALRCAGYYQALQRGEKGKCCVFVEISGADGVMPVMVDPAAGMASASMPLPRAVRAEDWPEAPTHRVMFAGITHFVIERAAPEDALVQRALQAAPEAEAVGAVFLNRESGSIRPVVCVRETSSCVAESSCASGSTAAAIILAQELRDGIMEIGIGQPGGDLEVGVCKHDGAVTGLSIGGPVRLERIAALSEVEKPAVYVE